MTLAIPWSRWGAEPFFISPVLFPSDVAAQCAHPTKHVEKVLSSDVHPYQMAMRWAKQLQGDRCLTRAKIAKKEGLSRARVTQIMNLLDLPPEIQDNLLKPPTPLTIHSFSERRLRSILAAGSIERQLEQWHGYIQDLEIHNAK